MRNHRRRGKLQNTKKIVDYMQVGFSKQELIDIQTEAYYQALKKIDYEKSANIIEAQSKLNQKWYKELLKIIIIMFCPFLVGKYFKPSNDIYNEILIIFVAGIFWLVGLFIWLFGIGALFYSLYTFWITQNSVMLILALLSVIFVLYGALFIISGTTFYNEKDVNKIYAFSASFIALVSCILTVATIAF